jgi:drug/metabolite transporter (DMT)-like permease
VERVDRGKRCFLSGQQSARVVLLEFAQVLPEVISPLVYLLLLFVTFVWAGNYPAGKIALGVIGPMTLIAFRTAIGAALLTLMVRQSHPNWKKALFEDLFSTVILSVTGVAASGLLFYFGLKYTTASNAGIISASTPIWVTLLSWMFLAETARFINVCGILLSFSGLVTIVCQGSLSNLLNRSFNRGDLFILIGQLNWAVYTVYGRKVMERRPATLATASAYLVGAMLLFPLTFLESPAQMLPQFSVPVFISAAYLCILSPLSNLWYSKALVHVSPHRAAIFMNLMPIIVLIFSALVLHEQITTAQMVGSGMVIGGVVLTTRF